MAKKETGKTASVKPVSEADERKRALDLALANIEKTFGQGAVMRLGENAVMNVEAISTGSLSLDIALGIGGIPKGRIVEIYGPESSGKTTVALHVVAEVQKGGGNAAFIDAEHALDPIYAKALGVNIDELLVSQPDNGEEALEICEALARSGAVDVIVIDSVAAMVPKSEIEGMMGDSHVGLQARLMSQALRKLTSIVAKSGCTLIFINQLRMKIGVMYGNPETTTGGNALKFYASVRIDIRKQETLKVGSEMVGSRTRCKIVKNKVAPPFKEAFFDIMYGQGISYVGEVLDMGVELGILKKAGAFFSYQDLRLGQGRDNSKNYLKEHPEVLEEIAGQIKAKLMNKGEEAETVETAVKKTPMIRDLDEADFKPMDVDIDFDEI